MNDVYSMVIGRIILSDRKKSGRRKFNPHSVLPELEAAKIERRN